MGNEKFHTAEGETATDDEAQIPPLGIGPTVTESHKESAPTMKITRPKTPA